jgi:hypothetical protein
MIRRDIVHADRDQRVVKWSLVAATFALSLGCFAEVTLARSGDETAPIVAEKTVEADADRRVAG